MAIWCLCGRLNRKTFQEFEELSDLSVGGGNRMASLRKENLNSDVLRSVSEGTHSLEWALRCGGVGVFLEYRNGEVHTTALTREWFSIPADSPIVTAEQLFCCVHPEDLEHAAQARQEMLDNEAHFQVKFRVIDAEGQVRWLCVEGNGGEPGSDLVAACTVRDITEQLALERRLAEANAQLAELLRTDMLTRLYTRRHFELSLEEHCAEAVHKDFVQRGGQLRGKFKNIS